MTLPSYAANRFAPERRRGRAWCVAGGFVLVAATAAAEPVIADSQRAEQLFNEGRAAMAAEHFDVACSAFAESQKLDPAAGTLINWGVCLEAQGKTASAFAAYWAGLASNQLGSDPDRQRFVEERVGALEPRLCRVTIAVPADSPPDLQVKVDATVLAANRWNTPALADPGAHLIEASAPGRQTWFGSFTIESDGSVRVVHVPPLAPLPAPPASPPPSPLPPTVKATPNGSHQVALVVAGGLAALGVAGTVYFGARAASAWDERENHCPEHRCDAAAVSASNRAADFAHAADVALAVTAVAVGAGVFIVLSSTRAKAAPRSGIELRGARDGAQIRWSSQF